MQNTYKKLKNDIKTLIHAKECITFCGLPLTGKTRFIKEIVSEQQLENKFCFINLEIFNSYDSNDELLLKLQNELENNYANGKRIFLFQYAAVDTEICSELYKELEKFRQKQFDRPSYIFLLNTNPYFYKETFQHLRLIFSNIVYLKLNDKSYYEMVKEGNEERFQVKTPTDFDTFIYPMTAGIAVFIKEMVKQFGETKKIPILDNIKEQMKPFLNQLMTELPEKELVLYKKFFNKEKLTNEELTYLSNIGFETNDPTFPKLLSTFIENYSRKYTIAVSNGKIYINGSSANKQFTSREVTILSALFDNEITTRALLSEILNQTSGTYSDYAIDKVLSRLRKKLNILGINPKIVKTIKRQGFTIDKSLL